MIFAVSSSGCATSGKPGAYHRTREDAKMVADGARIVGTKDKSLPAPLRYMTGTGIIIAGVFHMIVFSVLPDTITLPADINHEKKEPNQSLQTTTMAVTDAAAQPPRQP